MTLPFRQQGIGWCTVYLLANLFRNGDFLRYVDRPDFKGCTDKEVDHILAACGYDKLRVSTVVYCNQHYPRIPKNTIYSIIKNFEWSEDPTTEIDIVPYTLSVRLIEAYWHSVGILMYKGHMLYIDPYKEQMIEVKDVDQFESLFIDCCQVQRFYDVDTDNYISFRGEYMGYDFLKELNAVVPHEDCMTA